MRIRPLDPEVGRYIVLRERLVEAFPRIDDETLHDTLEGITTLEELIAETVRSALLDEAFRAGLNRRLEDLKERGARLERRAALKRQYALVAMRESGLKKLEQSDFTASVRAGVPALVVEAESEIPDDFWVPQPARLSRSDVLKALKKGDEVPGAYLRDPQPTLSVRTK
ncbi:MAG: siphovirus Gp157 family protein [Methyloceanibacter sp.]|nr:siphovirus Gp157 family protein [Methyloceanibacter sp.]